MDEAQSLHARLCYSGFYCLGDSIPHYLISQQGCSHYFKQPEVDKHSLYSIQQSLLNAPSPPFNPSHHQKRKLKKLEMTTNNKRLTEPASPNINIKLGERWTPPESRNNSPITTPIKAEHGVSLPIQQINLITNNHPETPSKLVLIIPHNHVEDVNCDSTALKIILPDSTMSLSTLAPTHILQLGQEPPYYNHRISLPQNSTPTDDASMIK